MKEKEFINYINKGYKLIPLTETIKLEDFNPIDLYESLIYSPDILTTITPETTLYLSLSILIKGFCLSIYKVFNIS